MYAWVFGINGKCIRGRTWREFLVNLEMLTRHYTINLNRRFIIYVHNLSYEFQWLQKYFKWHKVFALDSRKPLYAITEGGIEFRCSYLLSGYSLETLGKNLTKYKVTKKVGDLDYSMMRHSQTPITEKEWGYILNDGLVVMAHIQEEIERLGDLSKLPLTKTGYVRNLCFEKCLKGDNRYDYAKSIKSLTLTPETYKMLKDTYSGGFTHANVNYVDRIVSNVHSFDFSSSYPSVMIAEKYPMSKPIPTTIHSEEDFIKYLTKYCCMFEITFYNLTAKVNYENYISLSRTKKAENYLLNNGRIIEADLVKMCITEQDYFIIEQLYDWDCIEIGKFYRFYKGYLPKDLIVTILELYRDKTELKGVEDKIVEYLVSKGMINSVYGMCVTDPCKNDNVYDGNGWHTDLADIDKLISKYNSSASRTLYYPWGVWVTAYARKNLFTGIIEFKDDYVYSDTDSIKVLNINKHREYIDAYNNEVISKINKCLEHYDISTELAHPKTIKGVSKPLGVWDYEGEYSRFKTLGAKRYITEQNGELSITVAGVNKYSGAKYLKCKYGDNTNIFNNFVEDLYFPPEYDSDGTIENGSGKLCHTYIDENIEGDMVDYMGNEYHYKELSCVHMENTDYTMGLDAMFAKLIHGVKEGHLV